MLACAGCGATKDLSTVENRDPATGHITGLVDAHR